MKNEKYIEQYKEDYETFKVEFVEQMEKEVKAFFIENKNPPGDGVDAALGRLLLNRLFVISKEIELLKGLMHKHEEFEQ